MLLPDNLPIVSAARLPDTYETAKTALAECSRIDECADWANKAEALASYAKQANDDQMRKMADRIQARAIRRCGELLKQIEPQNGARTDLEPDKAALTRSRAAEDAGLSLHQQRTAIRVANVPADDFDGQIESDNPPTVTTLAEQGKQPRPLVDLQGRDPEEFAQSTYGQGHLREFAEFAEKNDPAVIARGAFPREHAVMRRHINTIDNWLDRLVVQLEG